MRSRRRFCRRHRFRQRSDDARQTGNSFCAAACILPCGRAVPPRCGTDAQTLFSSPQCRLSEAGDSLIKDYRPKTVSTACASVRVSLGETVPVLAVEQFVRQNGISENTLFLGAFAYALGKYILKIFLRCPVLRCRFQGCLSERHVQQGTCLPERDFREHAVSRRVCLCAGQIYGGEQKPVLHGEQRAARG